MANLKPVQFSVGKDFYLLSPWEQQQHNWFLVKSHLADEPEHNYRFYNDDYLMDLLDIANSRENRGLMDLAKIYLDNGNLAPYIVQTYKAMAMAGIDTDSVTVVDNNGETNETETEKLRMWLEDLNDGGFEGFLDEYLDGAAVYGTGYVALRDKGNRSYEGICKDAMGVYPVIDPLTNRPAKVLVHYYETEAGTQKEEQWVEEYLSGEVNVYRNGRLVPEVSGSTGINELTIIGAPFRTMRGSYFGRGALDGLIESLVTLSGAIGSAYNTYRIQAGGIVTISSDENVLGALESAGGGPMNTQSATGKAMVKRVLDPDAPTLLAGKNLSVAMVQGNVMGAADPLLERLLSMFAMRCPIYAWSRLGANASGEAIKQTMMLLRVEMNEIRRNLRALITQLSKVLGQLYRSQITGSVKFAPPDVFAPTPTEQLNEAIVLFEKGVVPLRYVAQVANIESEPLVNEHLERAEASAIETNAPAENANAQLIRSLFGTELEV